MRFGVFLQPLHPSNENPTVALELDLDLMVHLDKLGYDEAWIGEHHSTGWENVGSPEVFIAAAAERTKHIRFGTGVIQLGLHNPLVLLDRMILLDHLTRGRVSFGLGVGGGLPSDLKVFGLSREQAGKRLDEGIAVILELLRSGKPVDARTDWFELHHASLQIGPYTKPHMPFAIASGDPRNVELMGRLGGQVLLGPIPERIPDLLESLQRGADAANTSSSQNQFTLSYAMHIADTREEAIANIKEAAIAEQYEFNVAINRASAPDVSREEWFEGFLDRHIIGSPDDAIEKLESIQSVSGGVGGVLFTSRDWASTQANRASWELFARQVAPHFQRTTEHQKAAAKSASFLNSN